MPVQLRKQFIGMRDRRKKIIFICRVESNCLQVIKCLARGTAREFISLNKFDLSSGIKDAFQKLGYNGESVILSLPRNNATTRYLKVPSSSPEEIEGIVNLQASRYLPYPANELITAYEILDSDRQGYSFINLIIAHKDALSMPIKVLKELGIAYPNIILSSYGLYNLYTFINQNDNEAKIILNIDSYGAEAIVIDRKKLIFSRYFKLDQSQQNWDNLLRDELNKTQEACFKDMPRKQINKLIVVGPEAISQKASHSLSGPDGFLTEVLNCKDKINISNELHAFISNADNSYFDLIGLGLKELPASLNLIPESAKEELRKLKKRNKQFGMFIFIIGILLIWFLALTKNLDNKAKYLVLLKQELSKISQQAKPLDDIDKRLKMLQARVSNKPSALDFLYEVNRVIPAQVSLSSFSYDESKQVNLRGQANELNSVFLFVSEIEKSPLYKDYNIKIRYATKKKTTSGEIVDFEIGISRK